ncbi:MAG: DUF5666 domain-containing protein [Planctomycetota bacterium]|nr:DUF5666 domain-containing protein [Planctomycetota bacterium]
MRSTRTTTLCFAALLALALGACGGGGSASLVDGGGIGGTGLRIGPNEQDGAVQVDGIAFDASAATVTISGLNANEGDVRRGMVVVVSGSVSGTTGTASSVDVEEVLEGEIQQLVDATTMIVQGQMVQVDETTVYGPGISPPALAGFTVGELLEVYGFVRESGVIFATRIERESSLSELRARGIVTNLSTAAQTFRIGEQVVDYSGADTSDLPGGVPANGQLVCVRGLNALSPAGELVATEVELVDFDELDDAEEAEVEGFVTEVISESRFRLGGQLVETNGETVFEGGSPTDIVVGVRLDVSGERLNDLLVADEVEFEAAVVLESDVATKVGSTLTLVGLPGITVNVNELTEYDGNASALTDVLVGDHVEIRARRIGPTTVIAVSVVEEDADTRVILQGPVDAVPAPSDPLLSILGVSVDTTGLSNDDFEGANDLSIGRAVFFSEISAGVLVKAQGDLSGSNVVWDEMELEGEDD